MPVDLTSIFYPTSPSKVADPDEGAALFAKQYSQSPNVTIIVDFADFIIESTPNKPEHVDSLIQAALLISCNEFLPTAYWTSDRPKSTFDETSEREEFLNGSFIAGRARSLGLMTSPETVGAVGEGLEFPGEVIYNSTGEIAEIRALGACLQLLGSASKLIELFGNRFAVEKVVKSLEGIRVSAADKPLVDLTIRHLQSAPLKDITSSEVVQSTRSAGWNGLWANTGALAA
ncbi:hypothetical protein BDZ97DRAFT_1820701 [Flammula alnicola]|nr:hypothetical protein BDZ97DRAFT_1820701 [Flammula alnicola]